MISTSAPASCSRAADSHGAVRGRLPRHGVRGIARNRDVRTSGRPGRRQAVELSRPILVIAQPGRNDDAFGEVVAILKKDLKAAVAGAT